jgi:Tfp pilus assembly protein PilX
MRTREHGVVLLVAAIVTLALATVGMGMLRTVTTGAAASVNLASQQSATLAASMALERAVATLFEAGAVDSAADDVARNYFAARTGGDDARDVPRALRALADYPEAAQVIDAGSGYRVRHLIERSCVAPGIASIATCTLSPPSIEAALGIPPPGEPPRMPYYRVTVRVDGASGTTTFVQATLCAAKANPRCSWRVLDE